VNAEVKLCRLFAAIGTTAAGSSNVSSALETEFPNGRCQSFTEDKEERDEP